MDIAYSGDYQIVSAQNAVKGRKYYCPVCNGELLFFPGKKNAPHFRHGKGVPSEIKDNCELYSQNLGEFNIHNEEFEARQKVRLVLEKQENIYAFKLKLPLIKQNYIQMQLNNLYFSYYCKQIKEFDLNTVQLLPTRKMNEVTVSLLEKYSLIASNEQYEKKLGLRVSGDYIPFVEGPLIFKEIQGQYISLPYRRITLSGLFFIVSKRPLLSIHGDLVLINKVEIGHFHIYEFIMPVNFSDELQRWFTVNLHYSLIPATYHLDIVSPTNFKKVGTTIEITNSKSYWQLTNIGERPFEQRLIIIDSSNKRQILRVSSDKTIQLELEKYGDYLMYLDQEMSDIITVRYLPLLTFNNNYFGNVKVNDTDVLFDVRELNADQVKVQSDLSMLIYSPIEMHYEIKNNTTTSFDAPIRIDFPRLWSLTVKKSVNKNKEGLLELLFDIYDRQHLYPKIICDLKVLNRLIKVISESEFKNKDKLLLTVRKMGIRIPNPVLDITEIMEH